jgi:hypothetical protein
LSQALIVPVSRQRNPKSETRSSKEVRMPKFKFRHSDFLRISGFGFRISGGFRLRFPPCPCRIVNPRPGQLLRVEDMSADRIFWDISGHFSRAAPARTASSVIKDRLSATGAHDSRASISVRLRARGLARSRGHATATTTVRAAPANFAARSALGPFDAIEAFSLTTRCAPPFPGPQRGDRAAGRIHESRARARRSLMSAQPTDARDSHNDKTRDSHTKLGTVTYFRAVIMGRDPFSPLTRSCPPSLANRIGSEEAENRRGYRQHNGGNQVWQ